MKLATTTHDFHMYKVSHFECVKYVHEAGFKYIDFSIDKITSDDVLFTDNWMDEITKIKDYAKEKGLQFVQAHAPSTNPLKDEDEALWQTVRAIEICGTLSIPNIVVHAGVDENISSKNEWFEKTKYFYTKLFPYMEKYNVNVLCENGPVKHLPNNCFGITSGQIMKELIDYVNHPLFHGCWDVGHAHMNGPQYEDILAVGDDLYAIHFHDNNGEGDQHTIPFFGTISMDEIMCALKDINYKGFFTFEACMPQRPAKLWLGDRCVYEKDSRLLHPPLSLHRELEKYLYKVGEYILQTHDCYNE